MSYSRNTKEELLERYPKARHCRIAELAGFYAFGGSVENVYKEDGEPVESAIFRSDNPLILKKFFTLLKKTITISKCDKTEIGSEDTEIRLEAGEAREFLQMIRYDATTPYTVNRVVLQEPCCRRSFLRAAFLMSGSLTNPNKGYHFEINCRDNAQAGEIKSMMEGFGLTPKTVERQGHPVIYLKESDEISDMLGVMEAPVTLMDFENVRVQKDLNNAVNRKVNCETANIGKMVNAAVREVRDIELIEKTVGLSSLPKKLQEMAELRLEHPDMPLRELGELLDPPVGKSGVNHRLRRISQIAEDIRN